MAVKTARSTESVDLFRSKLDAYRSSIDARIADYAHELDVQTSEEFGKYPAIVTRTFIDSLSRGGKRIRGAVLMNTYYMLGGEDEEMILDAALALEMLNTFVLMMDDIQDRSETRRGGKTSHIAMRDYHQAERLKGDAEHFGISMAIDALMTGYYAAMEILTNLNAQPEIVLKALRNVQRCYLTTAHGQTLDIFNEVTEAVSEEDIENVLIWKTAYYTFVNPSQLGAILAGADDSDLQQLFKFSIPAGKVFQITDDILGMFGNDAETGKSVFDDIEEGKQTVLTAHALHAAEPNDVQYLERCLGKHGITAAEFKRCQQIITNSGALAAARQLAEQSADEAIAELRASPKGWRHENIRFLDGLVHFLLTRKA